MLLKHKRNRDRLRKKARQGFRGYPVATVAYYGPNDRHATKVVVGIMSSENDEGQLHKWIRTEIDVRSDPDVLQEIADLLQVSSVKSVVVTDRIIGCPHEEGIDYPDGEGCPVCLFWVDRDRFTGQLQQ